MSNLHRNLNDWGMGKLCRLLSLLDWMKLDSNMGDGWEWIISKKCKFTSKSLYLELVGNMSVSFPHKGIWIPGIPFKVAFFIWNVFLDKILLIIWKVKRGIWLTNVWFVWRKKSQWITFLFIVLLWTWSRIPNRLQWRTNAIGFGTWEVYSQSVPSSMPWWVRNLPPFYLNLSGAILYHQNPK